MRSTTTLHHDYDTPKWRDWVSGLAGLVESLSDDRLIQGGRNRLYLVEHDGCKVVLKVFSNKGLWKKIGYRFKSSKARRSYENSLRLIEAGLDSPQPIAWREDREGPWLSQCFYVCSFAGSAHEARALQSPDFPERELKASLVGDAIGRMHEAGIMHLDLTPGNVLFVEKGAGQWRLPIVDNNRMAFGSVSLKKGVYSLLQMDIGADLADTFVRSYAKARGYDEERCFALYERRLRAYKLKWRIKNVTRPYRRKIGL